MPHNKRSHSNKKPKQWEVHAQQPEYLVLTTLEKSPHSNKDPAQSKIINKQVKLFFKRVISKLVDLVKQIALPKLVGRTQSVESMNRTKRLTLHPSKRFFLPESYHIGTSAPPRSHMCWPWTITPPLALLVLRPSDSDWNIHYQLSESTVYRYTMKIL